LYSIIEQAVGDNWVMPKLSSRWDQGAQNNITRNVTTLVNIYRKFGHLVFSTEPDGLAHMDIAANFPGVIDPTPKHDMADLQAQLENQQNARALDDQRFEADIDANLSDEQWDTPTPQTLHRLRDDENVMSKIIKALGHDTPCRIATSYPNRGAVAGFTDRTVLEYSQLVCRHGIKPAGRYEVPAVFAGLLGGLAMHQTLLGDAIATLDPQILFEAMYAYPVHQDSLVSRRLWQALLTQNASELHPNFQLVAKMFTR
jgi:alpha-galactosidase/6-phospho-beta-glucosidase family protein